VTEQRLDGKGTRFRRIRRRARFERLAAFARLTAFACFARFARMTGFARFAGFARLAAFDRFAGFARMARWARSASCVRLAGFAGFARFAELMRFAKYARTAGFARLTGSVHHAGRSRFPMFSPLPHHARLARLVRSSAFGALPVLSLSALALAMLSGTGADSSMAVPVEQDAFARSGKPVDGSPGPGPFGNASLPVWSAMGPSGKAASPVAAESPEGGHKHAPASRTRPEDGIARESDADSAPDAARGWMQSIAELPGYERWNNAEAMLASLGPGRHGWLALVKSGDRTIGHMIIFAKPEGGFVLSGFGPGEPPADLP